MKATGRWLVGYFSITLLSTYALYAQDAEPELLPQALVSSEQNPVPIDDGGGQAAAMSAGSGAADGTGAGAGVVTTFGYAEDGGRVWKQTASGLQVWIGGLYEEKGGKTLCHVFAAGKRLATFEPSFGGPYASVWAPKQIWAQTTETADAIATWPLREGRTPWTVLFATLLLLLVVCLSTRHGWGWTLTHRITRRLATLLPLLGERAGVRAGRSKIPNSQFPIPDELTPRERRWFTQPLWRQALSVFMIVALVFVTTPTDVRAQTYDPVFYYYEGDHLGSSNVMTDRSGTVVQHYEYNAFGSDKSCTITAAFQVSNRYTGQVLDEETGLYYYNARYYDPELGRFTQPDTMVPDPGDSQQLNRYSYVNNNPLKYTDPSGHIAVETAIIIGVVVGAAVGAATAAAQGASGSGIALAAGLGALGGLFGGVGAWAGGAIGAAASGASTATLAAASASAAVGTFIGAVAGGAAGGAVSAAVYGGDVGMGALTGAVSGAIGFGVAKMGFSNPETFAQELVNAGLTTAGGAAGGAAGAAIQGGDPALGAKYGAMGAAIGFGVSYFLKCNNGPADPNDTNPGHHLMRLLGEVWNLPNTVIGLAWGGLGYAIDRVGTVFGRPAQMEISFGNNAIQFDKHPLMGTAITLGNTISYSPNPTYSPAAVGPEEFMHTFQAQQLGPLYLPSNVLGMTAALIFNQQTHGWVNWNERGPHSAPFKPWR